MPKPVYALVGSDVFLQLQKQAEILSQFPADVTRIDKDGERAELSDVLDELRSYSMFGGDGKVVIVRNGGDFVQRYRQPLEDYLEKPSDSGTLVLRMDSLPKNTRVYKLILKMGSVEECEPPKDLVRWVTDRAKTGHQLVLTPDAARMLADLVGADLGRMDNELAKLALQVEKGEKVTAELVSGSVAFQREQEMYDMTNQLASGNPKEAVRKWRQLIQTDSSAEFRAVTWLTMWLEKVARALAMKRSGTPVAAIGQQLRIWPTSMQMPFMKTAEMLGESGVSRGFDLLAEIDRNSKSGVGDAAANVERFLVSVMMKK